MHFLLRFVVALLVFIVVVRVAATVNICCPDDSVFKNDTCVPLTTLRKNDSEIATSTLSTDQYLSKKVEEYLQNFPAVTKIPSCSRKPIQIVFPVERIVGNKSNSPMYSNGYLQHEDEIYSPNAYCIESEPNDGLRFRVCSNECGESKGRLCLKKCCGADEQARIVDNNSIICEKKMARSMWQPPLYTIPTKKLNRNSSEETWEHFSTKKIPSCNYKVLTNDPDIWFRVMTDGSVKVGLRLTLHAAWLHASNSPYCIDELWTPEGQNETTEDKAQVLLYCDLEDFDTYLLQRRLYAVLYFVSALIMLVVVVIQILLWDTHKLSGWTILSFFVAWFLVYIMLGFQILINANGLEIQQTNSCAIIGILIHQVILTHLTNWVVVNYEMFRTFRKLNHPMEYYNTRRLIFYLLFAWGTPFIIMGTSLTIHSLTENTFRGPRHGIYEYAYSHCLSPVFYAVLYAQSFIILLNVIFFFSTMILICYHQRSVRLASLKSSCTFGDSAKLFFKLSMLSGFFFIPVGVFDFYLSDTQPMSWFWFIFRCNHFIADVFILVCFGFNEKNVDLLRKRFFWFKKICVLCKRKRQMVPASSVSFSTTRTSSVESRTTNC